MFSTNFNRNLDFFEQFSRNLDIHELLFEI